MTAATTSGTLRGATAVPSGRTLGTAPRGAPTPCKWRRKSTSSLRTSASVGGRPEPTVPDPAVTPSTGGAWPGPTALTTRGCGFSGGGFSEVDRGAAAAGADPAGGLAGGGGATGAAATQAGGPAAAA